MSLFRLLMGFTALNIVLQILRGNGAAEILLAIVIFIMSIGASMLWEERDDK